jgi:predicted SnoaL-like aldol condensation-catalyzing enzyme
MIDGPTEATHHALTETNRQIVRNYVEDILVRRHLEKLENYISGSGFIQHSPQLTSGSGALREALGHG